MSSTKIILILGTVVIGLMCFYPPYFCMGISQTEEILLKEAYYCVFSLPQNQAFNSGRSAYSIVYQLDVYRLFGQLIVVGIATLSIIAVLQSIQQVKNRRPISKRYHRISNSHSSNHR